MWLGSSQLHLDELFSPAIAGTLPREGGTVNIVELIRSADSLQKLQMQLEKNALVSCQQFCGLWLWQRFSHGMVVCPLFCMVSQCFAR